ncbi:hypothetical protein IAT40_000772 [Kwoniella sp. CBS 6097]
MAQTIAKEPKALKTGGDDLDDGLELDPDLLAASDEDEEEEDASDNEHEGEFEQDAVQSPRAKKPNGNGNGKLPVLEGEEDEILASPIAEGKKRKADEVDNDAEDEDASNAQGEVTRESGSGEDEGEARKAEKKRRKKEKEKERKARKLQKSTDPSDSNTPPTHLPPADISSILLRSIRESYPSASSVELEDNIIPTTHLLSPPDYTPPKEETQKQRSNSNSSETKTPSFIGLQKRVEDLLKGTEKKKLPVATPRIIILSLSGLRCADVVRGVRDVKGQGEVAKLFAKHFKLADQIKYLEKTKVSIAVGTPARVGKLLNEGAIKITSDTVLLLDITHQDSKTRTILTLPEVRDELWKTVFSGKARETLLNGGVRIGVF